MCLDDVDLIILLTKCYTLHFNLQHVTSGQTNLYCWTIKSAYCPSAGTIKATYQTVLIKTSSLNRYNAAKYSDELTVWRARLIYGKTLTTARHQSGINNTRTQLE